MNALSALGFDGPAALRTDTVREPRKEHLQIVVDFRDRADGAARGADVVDLLDGNGRRDADDGVHLGLVHALKKLPRVRRERLHVTPLALGVDGVEREGRFSRSAWPGNDAQFTERQVEIEALEVVLTHAANLNHVGKRRGAGGHGQEDVSDSPDRGKWARRSSGKAMRA